LFRTFSISVGIDLRNTVGLRQSEVGKRKAACDELSRAEVGKRDTKLCRFSWMFKAKEIFRC